MNFRNLAAYLHQRFPVVNMALFTILFLTVYSVAKFFYPAVSTPNFTWHEVLGIIATISFFFRLRVFDEVKDFDLDAINHPDRVLQSGKVSLKQLFTLAFLGLLLELFWSAMMGSATLMCWLLAFLYSLLMRYEFFVSSFLKKRLVLYAISHMLIMPLLILWLWSGYVKAGLLLNQHYFLLAFLSLLGGFSFEIARKIHAPAAERELVDSYSKSIGYTGAITTVLLILLVGVLVQCYLLRLLEASPWTYAIMIILYIGTFFVYVLAWRKPQEKILKKAELLVSLFMLVSYVSIIVAVYF